MITLISLFVFVYVKLMYYIFDIAILFSGLAMAPSGHIVVNGFQQTSDPDVYAIGDAVITADGKGLDWCLTHD